MPTLILIAGAAGAALAFAHLGLRDRRRPDAPVDRINRRVVALAIAGTFVGLLLGWAAAAVELGPSGLTIFVLLASLLAVALAYAGRAGVFE